jgi:beta-glucanase (GH16 family)
MMMSVLIISFIFIQSREKSISQSSLIWSDEFTGQQLDESKWSYVLGPRRDAINVKEMVRLDGRGNLVIKVSTDPSRIFAGMIQTDPHFLKRYGYFECRAKLTRAKGCWPAFWLLSNGNQTGSTPATGGVEIDIFEYFPHLHQDKISHNLHWGGYEKTHQELGLFFVPFLPTLDGFHTFGLEWTDSNYVAYVDGKETARLSDHISKVPQFMILSMECDASFAGPLDRSSLPDSLVVDYVRVYQRKDQLP